MRKKKRAYNASRRILRGDVKMRIHRFDVPALVKPRTPHCRGANLVGMVLLVLGLATPQTQGAVGDVAAVITPTPSGSQLFCAIGLAFDGTDLYVNRCSDPNIYAISAQDGSMLTTKSLLEPDPSMPKIPEWPAAMSYDPTQHGLWIATQMGVGGTAIGDCGSMGMPIYFWAFNGPGSADDTVTRVFTILFADLPINSATGDSFFSELKCTISGLVYDENNDEIWISGDRNRNLALFRPDGTFVKGLDAASVHITLLAASGLAIGGDKLYLANDGCDICGDVFRSRVDTDPLLMIDQFTNGGLSEQDMACDPNTFAPTDVMWVRTDPRGLNANDLITAYEIEPGGCGQVAQSSGACCVTATVSCTNNVSQATCQGMAGTWTQGATCPQVGGCVAHEIILLDRTGSMAATRQASGNTRCFDALETAKMDVDNFFNTHSAGSSLAVWIFADTVFNPTLPPIDLTGGFVLDADTAKAALANNLDGVACAGSTPLAESMCDAIDALTAAFPSVPDKARILAVSSDGDENTSDMNCVGPNSVAGMSCGGFDSGSWQQLVCNKIIGNSVAQVRFWGDFGAINNRAYQAIDPETGSLRSASVLDTIFFSALADATGGSIILLDDVPPPVTGPSIFGVTGACCLADTTCQESITEAECAALGGSHQGDASICADATGACCLPDDTCQDAITLTACTGQGGSFQGTCTTCANDVMGACCLPNSSCQDGLTPTQCAAQNGTHQGGCSVCTGTPGECRADVPTVSEWGLVLMTLLVFIVGTMIFRGRGTTRTAREGMIQ